jgi:hypothetical protein
MEFASMLLTFRAYLGRRVTLAEYINTIALFYRSLKDSSSTSSPFSAIEEMEAVPEGVIKTVQRGQATDDFFPSVECGPIDVSKVSSIIMLPLTLLSLNMHGMFNSSHTSGDRGAPVAAYSPRCVASADMPMVTTPHSNTNSRSTPTFTLFSCL